MIEEIAASIMAPKTGVLHILIRRSLDAGKETPEAKKAKEEQASEYTKRVQKVSQIYGPKGKLIEYNKYGRHLDITV